jgi:hypothetical protein
MMRTDETRHPGPRSSVWRAVAPARARARARKRSSVSPLWWLLALAAALPLFAPQARAQERAPERADRAELERSQIIGNRELPKVLYIVPWKKPLHGNMGGRAVTGVVDEALAPIDRDVLRRQVSYDAQLRAAVAPAVTPAPAPAK